MQIEERLEHLELLLVDAERRLARAERRHRRLKLLLAVSLGLSGICLALLYPQAEAVYRHSSVQLVGPDGRESVMMVLPAAAGEGSTILRLRDEQRRFVAELALAAKGPRVTMAETDSKGRFAQLDVSESGPRLAMEDPRNGWRLDTRMEASGPALSFSEQQGESWRPRMTLGLTESGPFLRALDAAGKVIAQWPVLAPGSGGSLVPTDVIQAKGFKMLDGNGKVRAELTMAGPEPMLTLRRASGRRSVSIGGADAPASVRLYDAADKPRLALLLDTDHTANQLVMFDEKGVARARLGIDPEGVSDTLRFYDDRGRLRTAVGVEHEASLVGLSGLDGEPRAVLGVVGFQPKLDFFNREQKRMTSLTVLDEGAEMVFADGTGTPRAQINVLADGSEASLSFLSEEPKLRTLIGVAGKEPVILRAPEVGRAGDGQAPANKDAP